MGVRSLGQKVWRRGMATHSKIIDWKIPWTNSGLGSPKENRTGPKRLSTQHICTYKDSSNVRQYFIN